MRVQLRFILSLLDIKYDLKRHIQFFPFILFYLLLFVVVVVVFFSTENKMKVVILLAILCGFSLDFGQVIMPS